MEQAAVEVHIGCQIARGGSQKLLAFPKRDSHGVRVDAPDEASTTLNIRERIRACDLIEGQPSPLRPIGAARRNSHECVRGRKVLSARAFVLHSRRWRLIWIDVHQVRPVKHGYFE
jgi:hypothetical protein